MADDYSPPLSTYEEDLGPPVGADTYRPPEPEPYRGDVLAPDRGAADPLRDRAMTAFDASQKAITGAAESMGKEAQIAAEKSDALAPLRSKIADYAARPLPEPPAPQAPPQVPQNKKNQEDWIMAAGLLGSLAGAATRRHVTNALAAFTGTLQGANEGQKQNYEQSMKTWEAENKRVLEANNMALNHYRDIMENRKLNLEQMSVELQMAAAQYDDKAMATAARSKNFQTIAGLYDKQFQALNQFASSEEKIQIQREQMAQKERLAKLKEDAKRLGMGTDPGQMQALIDAIGQGRQAPIRGRAGLAIMAEVARQYPDYTEAKYKENMFRGTMAAHTEMAANNAAERTAATQGANIEMISRTVRSLIPQALASSEKVDRSEFRQLNQLIQLYERNAISDPVLKRFAFDTIQVAEGWARSMNPRGQMRIDDRKIALDHISTVDGPEAYAAVLQGIDESLWREAKAVTEQRTHQALPPPIDFSRGGGATGDALMQEAFDALRKGVPPDAVMKRLQERGVDPSALFNPAGM